MFVSFACLCAHIADAMTIQHTYSANINSLLVFAWNMLASLCVPSISVGV